jgi:hypothetical protein
MFKSFQIVWLLLIIPSVNYSRIWHDTCNISNTIITPDVKSKGIMGVKIEFDSFLNYDSKHTNSTPNTIIVNVVILNDAGKPLTAIEEPTSFSHNGALMATKSTIIVSVKKKVPNSFFIPYYCINLPIGKAKLKYKISISVKDTSMMETERHIVLKGTSLGDFSITKPPTNKVKMLCSGVRISATDNGKSWDFGLSGQPDPVFKVVMNNGILPDYIYESPTVENSLSAAWIDSSPIFIISEGDQITLGIYDNDTLSDDSIGSISHTLQEWLEISKTAKELAFAQVTFCTVKVEKIK